MSETKWEIEISLMIWLARTITNRYHSAMRGDMDRVTNLEVRLDVLHFRLGVVAQEGVHAHYYARRAEATLRSVRLGDPLLHSVQFSSVNRNICPNSKQHIHAKTFNSQLISEQETLTWCCRYPRPWSRPCRARRRGAWGRRWRTSASPFPPRHCVV